MFQSTKKSINFNTVFLAKNVNKLNKSVNLSQACYLLIQQQQQFYSSNSNNVKSLFKTQNATKTTFTVPFGKNLTASIEESSKAGKADNIKLPENIRYTPCLPVCDSTDAVSPRPLIILCAWMLAQEKHLDKYRRFWFERGCDVISIRTSPLDLLLPKFGGRKNALALIEFLYGKKPLYDEIVVHALSVGGYQYGEIQYNIELNCDEKEAKRILKATKGLILDSVVFASDAAPGLSRAITQHPILQPLLQKTLEIFLEISRPIKNHYQCIEGCLVNNIPKRPGLLMYSNSDVVSSEASNKRINDLWKKNGIHSEIYCWTNTPHVLLYKNYPDDYSKTIDQWLKNINVTKIQIKL